MMGGCGLLKLACVEVVWDKYLFINGFDGQYEAGCASVVKNKPAARHITICPSGGDEDNNTRQDHIKQNRTNVPHPLGMDEDTMLKTEIQKHTLFSTMYFQAICMSYVVVCGNPKYYFFENVGRLTFWALCFKHL